jgi:DHA1 family bicyclomycin/chloramphenicol resistance-like MFS transporter
VTDPKASGMGRVEFIALCAMMFATIAFSIDAMLPALPEIGAELSPLDLNRAQLMITTFVLGMGIGTAFTGPLSDAFGRKRIILIGGLLYIAGSAVAWYSSSLEWVLLARVAQGLGAAGPRIATIAVIRDFYSGREMAKLMSFVMIIFTLVPALAPSMGAVIIAGFGWRGIFAAFILFSLISLVWMSLRLREPLARADRRPFKAALMWAAVKELFAHRAVRLSIYVQTLIYAMLFSILSSVQPIYDVAFDRGGQFPYWFGGIALLSGTAGFLNAALVMRLGMRKLVSVALFVQMILSGGMVALTLLQPPTIILFAAFTFWQFSVFFMMGMTLGNLNAIAMEPMGHIAGMAASVMGAVSTVISAAIAAPVGLAFNGTPLPLAIAIFAMAVLAYGLMIPLRKSMAYADAGSAAE